GTIAGGKATVLMRALEGPGAAEPKVLAEAPFSLPVKKGGPVRVEFWHSDQRLQLWVDGRLVVSGEYNWLPMERLQHALTDDAWAKFTKKEPTRSSNVLADPVSYRRTNARWETSGAAVELRGVALDRDLYYRAATHPVGVNQRDLGGTP